MTTTTFFAAIGAIVLVLGVARLVQARDWILRLLALNVASAGALIVLVCLAWDGQRTDPVPHALALTGIVIMVAVTGVGLALARLVESEDEAEDDAGLDDAPSPQHEGAPLSGGGAS